jgi:hypothetical protein
MFIRRQRMAPVMNGIQSFYANNTIRVWMHHSIDIIFEDCLFVVMGGKCGSRAFVSIDLIGLVVSKSHDIV